MFSGSFVTHRAFLPTASCVLWCSLLFFQAQWVQPEKLATQFTETKQSQPVPVKQCAECHEEHSQFFLSAPHRAAFQPSGSPAMKKIFDGGKYHAVESNTNYQFYYEDDILWMKSDRYPKAVRLNWIFGAGSLAHTPVGTWVNSEGKTEGLEGIISYYPGSGFGPTLGSSDAEPTANDPLAVMGVVLHNEECIKCIGCHTTYLPRPNGKIDEENLSFGLSCERCHTGTHEHLQEAREDKDPSQYKIEKLANLSARDSVLLCGECHRRPDNFLKHELDPNNILFLRFAPVGILQSKCFLKQEDVRTAEDQPVRFTCVSCHDPHKPRESDPEFYNQRCRDCHGDQKNQAVLCPQQQASSNCIQCHMPKIQVQQLKLTDHWIRVRDK